MKIVFSFQKDNLSKPQKQNIAFGAGLTPKMMQEIQQVDVLEISKKLAKKGIPTDFNGNKVIAWCCDKTVEIFEQLNKKFGQKLALPKGIFVEDFGKLNVEKPDYISFSNFAPTKLKKDSEEIISPMSLFFNTFETFKKDVDNKHLWFYDWNNIDEISNFHYWAKNSSNNFFLDTFLHEFAHVAHEDRLLDKIGGQALIDKLNKCKDPICAEKFKNKYGKKLSWICDYAQSDPFESIACDIPKRIVDSLDKETLMPTRNPFIDTPYENLSFWQRMKIPNYPDKDRPLKEILRNFWNGKFD